MTNRPSESPYSRHGAIDQTVDQRVRLYRITGTEQIWLVAHQTIGEWREWRKIAEENDIADPFNLRGFSDYYEDQDIIVPIEVDAEDGTTEDENFTTDLDRDYDLDYVTPGTEGTGYVQVVDLEGAGYTVGIDFALQFKAPGESAYGAQSEFKITDMKSAVGDTAVPHSVFCVADSEEYAITITLDLDTFLVFWFFREVPITFEPFTSGIREFLAAPTLELPGGRGES